MPALWAQPRLYAPIRGLPIMFSGVGSTGRASRSSKSIMVNDCVSDALTRIKNGYMAKRKSVELPKIKMVTAMSKLLVQSGYLEKIVENNQIIEAFLKYDEKIPVLTDLRRVSKPGRRIYGDKNHLPKVLGGRGLSIISTPMGLLTDKEARQKGVGGEIICEVW